METNIYNSFANIALLVTLSTSVVSMSYDTCQLAPKMNHNYNHINDITDWEDNSYKHPDGYQVKDSTIEKYHTIISFSKKIIQNNKDIDSEFVDIVNEKFWELI